MRQVAETLKNHALAETDPDLLKLYAKSAYNRYYYACYYLSADELQRITGYWIKEHKEVPKKILGQFRSNVHQKINRSALSPADKVTAISMLIAATDNWHDIVTTLKRARVAADYKPKTIVTKLTTDIRLNFGPHQLTTSDAENKLTDLLSVFRILDSIYRMIGII